MAIQLIYNYTKFSKVKKLGAIECMSIDLIVFLHRENVDKNVLSMMWQKPYRLFSLEAKERTQHTHECKTLYTKKQQQQQQTKLE